jgi:hypothetical protein
MTLARPEDVFALAPEEPSQAPGTLSNAEAPKSSPEVDAAIAAYRARRPLEEVYREVTGKDLPTGTERGECPACGSPDGFHQHHENEHRWGCHSSDHGASGWGRRWERYGTVYWHGDALDLELGHLGRPGDARERIHRLEELGFLAPSKPLQPAPGPPISNPIAWKPLTEFLDEKHPPLKMLCAPFISAGSLTMITAAPGSLKTWFVMDQALKTAQAGHKVLMVVEEGRPATIQKRFRYFGTPVPGVYTMVRQGLRIDDPASWKAFSAGVLAEGFDLVIFDPFADLHLEDENDAPAMRGLINQFKALAAAGPALIVVHHTVKSAWAGASRERPAVLLSDARGTGGQMGSVDLSLGLIRSPGKREENVRQAEVYVTKDKDGLLPKTVPESPAFRFKLAFDGEGMQTDLHEIDWKAEQESRQEKADEKKVEQAREATDWLEILIQSNPGKATGWYVDKRPQPRFSERDIRAAFGALKQAGKIRSEKNGKADLWTVVFPTSPAS